MDKNAVRERMLQLEEEELTLARKHYEEYLAATHVDASDGVDHDEASHAEYASEMAVAFHQPERDAAAKIDALNQIDFAPKLQVGEGSIVNIDGRYFVIAVSTVAFECGGKKLMGISTQAPIFEAIEGLAAGESVDFNGRKLHILEVF